MLCFNFLETIVCHLCFIILNYKLLCKNAIPGREKNSFELFQQLFFYFIFLKNEGEKNIFFLSLVQHKLRFVYRRRCSRPGRVYIYKKHTVHIFAYDSLGAQSLQRMLNFNLSFVFTNLTTFHHYTRHTLCKCIICFFSYSSVALLCTLLASI